MLVRAAERAASLGASTEAQRAFERALELTDDRVVQAELHERAGTMAQIGARADEAAAHYGRAIELFESAGATHPAARVAARLAEIMWDRGRLEQGLESMNRAFEVLSEEEPDEDLASLAAQLGRFMFFAGDTDRALQRVETALDLAEALSLPETLSQALNTKAILLNTRGRRREALALVHYSLDVALEHDKPSAALRAYYNFADMLTHADRYEDAKNAVRDGLTLARRVGNRYWEGFFLGQAYPLFLMGAWDDALGTASELPEAEWTEARGAFLALTSFCVAIHVHRGNLEEARRLVDVFEELSSSADVQERAMHACGKSRLLLANGDAAAALPIAETAFATREEMGITHEAAKESYLVAVEAALELGDLTKVEELLAVVEGLPPGRYPQFLRAHSSRFRAQLATRRGKAYRIEDLFKGAIGHFHELAAPFYLAVAQLEYAEWLASQDRVKEAEPLLSEAREIFELLEATPWLQRVDAVAPLVATP
jgi:tetratricopeptide (TPR) repeat protein